MKKPIYILLTILTIFIFSLHVFISPTPAIAQEYVVKPYLIIPSDWNTPETQEEIPDWKQDILRALEEVQSWYANTLNGKTFDFYPEVQVVSTEASVDNSSLGDVANYYKFNLPTEPRIIKISWIVGLWGVFTQGYGESLDNGNSGVAMLAYDQLLNLSAGPEYRDPSLATISHELGHAFGLVFAGYARAHPCTSVSEQECVENAPRPLPPPIEWVGSIMGQGLRELTGLNNSVHNPEIWKIYKSPFINPDGDSPPTPVTKAAPTNFSIDELSPQTVKVGEILEIRGTNFGKSKIKGQIILWQDLPGFARAHEVKQILEWSDATIKIVVEVPATRLCIFNPNVTGSSTLCTKIQTEGKPLPSLLNISLKITCGINKSAISVFTPSLTLVTLNQKLKNGEEIPVRGYHLSSFSTEGNFMAVPMTEEAESYTIAKGDYVLRALPVEGVMPIPESIPIKITDVSNSIEMSAEFHYPICPAVPSPSPTSTATPSAIPIPISTPAESPTSEESPTPQEGGAKQIIISNYEDFRKYNVPSDLGSETQVIENSNDEQEIKWEDSTLSEDQPVYVREIYQDGEVKDYSVDLDSGEETQVGNVKIKEVEPETEPTPELVPEEKSVTLITINDQMLWSSEYGSYQLNLNLLDQLAYIIWVYYSDGSSKPFSLTFQRPEEPEPSLEPQPTEEPQPQTCDVNSDGPGWEYRGCADVCPNERWYCKYDNIEYPIPNPDGECACQ